MERWGRRANGGRAVCFRLLIALLMAAPQAQAQWRMQRSGTRASLRGVHAVDGEVAWASGSEDTVLRTRDGGRHWQPCATPPGAEKLDFRSVWAWDAGHAMVMSSGPGQQSRLYSTQDGSRSWRMVFANPDADGFWDSLQFDGARFGVILGDPVHGSFTLFATYDGGSHWTRQTDPCLRAVVPAQGAFAASNQAMAILAARGPAAGDDASNRHQVWFGASGGWLYGLQLAPLQMVGAAADREAGCIHQRLAPALRGPASGIFALAFRDARHGVAVGGNYAQPQSSADSAGFTVDGDSWQLATAPPSGYRSTAAWDPGNAAWIAAGPTGSDISRDDGRTWRPLEVAGSGGSWNALSLPFAVGPDGRIARLISWGQLQADNSRPKRNPLRGR